MDPLLDVSLPSFLAAGNVPYLAARADTTYVLYTEEEDFDYIRSAPSFKRLESLVSVKMISISEACGPGATNLQKYYRVAACTNHCIRNFVDEETGLVIAVPDCVFSDGSLAVSHEQLSRGKRLIACTGLSVVKQSFLSELPEHSTKGEGSLSITPRALARLGVKHLHPLFQVQEWNSESGSPWPSVLHWKVAGEGLIVHALHYHPLVVQPYMKGITSWGTMDGLYALRACPRYEDIHFVTDSEEFCGFSFTDESYALSHSGTPLSPDFVDQWAKTNAHIHQRMSLSVTVRYHWGPLSAEWHRIEREADQKISQMQCTKPQDIRISIQERPTISVCLMPGYSQGELERSLHGLSENIRPPSEVIVLSDKEMSSPLNNTLSKFKIRCVPVDGRLSQGEHVRSALPLVSGECCTFLQSGFVPCNQWLEATSSALARHTRAQLCLGNAVVLDERGQPIVPGGSIAHSEAELSPEEFLRLLRRSGLLHNVVHSQPTVYRTGALHRAFMRELPMKQGTFSFLTQFLALVYHSVYVNELCLSAGTSLPSQDASLLRYDVQVQKQYLSHLNPGLTEPFSRCLNPSIGTMLETLVALSEDQSTFFEGMLPLDAISRVSLSDLIRYAAAPAIPESSR